MPECNPWKNNFLKKFISVRNVTSTRYKLAFFLVSSSNKNHHPHLESIIHSFPRYIFTLHFDLGNTKNIWCNLVAIFLAIVVKVLHYVQNTFSFKVKPVRAMTITTNELLYWQYCFSKWRCQYVLRDWI